VAKNNKNLPLRQFHKLGKIELDRYRRLKREKKSVYGRLASKSATEKNRLFEARRFAQLYDGKDLDWLCSLGLEVGRPLTKLHVRELIRVTAQAARKRLAQQCAEQSWSVQQLQFEIARVQPSRRYSGAPYRVPSSVSGKLVVTEELLRKLIRWINVLSASRNKAKQPHMKQLPKNVQTKLNKFKEMAVKLEALCATKRGQSAKPPLKAEQKSRRRST
jgi:hypothetical protein